MDSSAVSWLSEMGMDDSVFTDEFEDMDMFDIEWAGILGSSLDSPPSLFPGPKNSSTSSERPLPKLKKPNGFSGFSSAAGLEGPDHRPSSAPIILNFGEANLSLENLLLSEVQAGPGLPDGDEEAVIVMEAGKKPNKASKQAEKIKRQAGRANKGPQVYDHIVAERTRREQLSQRFVTLTTIVPGLKKMDKTSVLGDAIKYMQHLQDQVKILEEKTTKKMMESVVLVRKSRVDATEDYPFEEKRPGQDEQTLPEIEARLCGSQILIRIHCENRRGLLANLMNQLENLNLTIGHTNVTTFGCLALDITIITEMGKDFSLATNEVVRRLGASIKDI